MSIVKIATALLVLVSLGASDAGQATNAPAQEPVYEKQPLSYWLEGLGKWDARAVEATKAVKALGMRSVPFILQYTCLSPSGATNQADTGRAVARACRILDQGKPNRSLDKQLRSALKNSQPQVRINAIAALPPSEKFKPDLEKLGQDPDAQVRLAATNALNHLVRYQNWLKNQQVANEPSKPSPKKSGQSPPLRSK